MKDKTIHSDKESTYVIRYTEYPMVRFLVVCVLGMLCLVISKNFSLDTVYILNIIVILSAGILIVFHTKGLYYVLTFLTGFFLMNGAYTPIPHQLEGKIIPAHFKGTLESIDKKTDSTMRCILEGNIKIVSSNGVISDEKYPIRLQSNILGDSIPTYLNIGTTIESIVQIQFPKNSYFPTESNSKQILISKDIHAFSSIAVENIVLSDDAELRIENILHQWRNHVESKLRRFILPENIPVILGMLFDNTSGILQGDLELLGSFGLIHILSASGTHILVISIICWLSLFVIRSHLVKAVFLGIFLILFVLVTGVQVSAFRAAIMSFTVLLLPHFSRTIRPLNLLAFSTIILLIYQPTLLFSYSFYFSTTAIIGIYFSYEKLRTLLKMGIEKISFNFYGKRFLNTVLIPSISLSLSAGLITNIIGSIMFYKFSISSIIGNTVFLFLYVLAFVSSIITYLFSFFSVKLAYFSGIATSFFLDVANLGMENLKLFIPTELNGYSIWIVTTFLCIGTFYCIATKELRTFVFRCLVVLLCFPFTYLTAKNLPYQVKEMVYRFPNATLLPIHQDKDTVTYFLNADPKTKIYSLEHLKRFLPISQKQLIILYNIEVPMIDSLEKVNDVTTNKISKREQFLLYKYYLHKKTSQSTY